MNCENCDNEKRLSIVPKKYCSSGKNLCIHCYNLHQFQWGEPYLCSRCKMTQLRMADTLKCYSCKKIDSDKNKNIKKIDYRNQSIKRQCLDQMVNKNYNANYKHLSDYLKLTDENCPIMMCDIPEALVKFCMTGRHTYEEVAEYASQFEINTPIECSLREPQLRKLKILK